ncbi:c-type cytochrome [Pontibacter chitinilyticus]|uniref:c-type cytochrome n=1 Tax=Pontibacter chitinilyticus TaxID=2674989 RepID=UPI00321A0471
MMKKVMLFLGCCALLSACGGNNENAGYEKYYDSDRKVDTAASADTYVTPIPDVPSTDDATADTKTEATATAPATTAAATTTPETTTTTAAAQSSDNAEGKKLIAQSDCLSCHREQEKLVGPAYADVAKKYEATDKNISYLVQKIQKGGAGVWGQIPMTPHPDLSDANAKAMVQYILSLNGK